MTVNQVRSLSLTSALERNWHANARNACRVFNEAVLSCLCHSPFCADRHSPPKLRPHPGTHAECLPTRFGCRYLPALANSLVIGAYSHFRIGIQFAMSPLNEAAAIAPRRTPQPTSSERTAERTTPARHISVLAACGCPSHTSRISG